MKLRTVIPLLLILALVMLPTHSASATSDDTPSGWQTWLSTPEKMAPLARIVNQIALSDGLDGLTGMIRDGIAMIDSGSLSNAMRNLTLAEIWIASINAAMFQKVDPMPNPAYQPIIDKGMSFSGDRLGIPDIRACMEMTLDGIIRAQRESL